jgi:excisionase family DNA binding protein
MTIATSVVLPIRDKLLFDRREVSALSGLSLRFVDILIANGTIRATRVSTRVLISRQELLRFAGVTETSNKG